jgi:hypothetical protein
MSVDVHKSGVFYSRLVLCMTYSRSAPACLEMCGSLKLFNLDLSLDEALQECPSISGDVHKSGAFYSGLVLG